MKRVIKIKFLISFSMFLVLCFTLHSQVKFETKKIMEDSMILKSEVSHDGGYLVLFHTFDKNDDYETMKYSVLTKYDVNGNKLWQKEFIADIIIHSFAESSSGDIFLVGSTFASSSIPNIFHIIKLTSCGELEWHKTDDGSDMYEYNISFIITDVNDGVVIFVRSISYGYSVDENRAVKIGYDGEVIWNKLLHFGKGRSSYDFNGSTVDNDGNIITNGFVLVKAPGVDATVLGTTIVKLDRDGDILWESCSGDDFNSYGSPWEDPIVDNDNNVFATIRNGWSKTDYSSKTLSSNPIIKNDQIGNTVCNDIENEDTDPSGSFTQLVGGFSFTDNKEHIVTVMSFMPAGYEGSEDKNANVPNLLINKEPFYTPKINERINNLTGAKGRLEDLSHITNRLYVVGKNAEIVRQLDLDYNVGELAKSTLEAENNNIVVFSFEGFIYDGLETPRSYMRKYTSNLEPASIDTSERVYDPFCSGEIRSGIIDLSEGSPLRYPTAVDDIYDTEKSIRVYPNPATDDLKIYLSRGLGEKTVDFYDAMGRLYKTVKIGEGWAQESVNIADMPKGIYFLKLTVNNELIGSEKLIVK